MPFSLAATSISFIKIEKCGFEISPTITAIVLLSPERKKLAEAFGADGYECNTMEEFEKAFSTAFEKGAPAVIDCHINMDEMVLPMTPPGGTVDQMILKKKDVNL